MKITARDLRDLLAPVMATTEKSGFYPVLNAVRLSYANGYLLAVSTDRFRVSVRRLRVADAEGVEPFAALLGLGDLRRLLAVFRPVRSHNPDLTLTADAESVTVTDYAVTLTLRHVAGKYPDVEQLVRDALARDRQPETIVGLNPAMLADVAKHGGQCVTMAVDPKLPIVIQGEDFVYLQMPRRLIGSDDAPTSVDADSWADVLGVTA